MLSRHHLLVQRLELRQADSVNHQPKVIEAVKGADYRPRIAPEFWEKTGKIGKD